MNCHPTLCGMLVEVEDGRLVSVTGDKENPDSRGFLCIRGHASREIFGNARRLLRPLVRARRTEDTWREASWDEVLDLMVSRMQAVGREAVGLWSGHGLFANDYGTRIGSQLLRRFANAAPTLASHFMTFAGSSAAPLPTTFARNPARQAAFLPAPFTFAP